MEQGSSVFVNRGSGQAAPLPFKRAARGLSSSSSYGHPHKARAALGTSADSSTGAFSTSPANAAAASGGNGYPDGAPDADMFMQARRMPSGGQGSLGWPSDRPTMTPNRKRSWAPSLNSPSYEQPNFVTSAAGTTSPVASRPLRTPQGEFSFDTSHASQFGNGWTGAGGAGGNVSLDHAKSPAAFPSSTWRLNHVQQQELERQRAIEMEEERRRQEPAAKRRRGMAGAIVETALNATLMAGAAAITAYSLWSSWGRKNDGDDEADAQQRDGDGRAAADANRPAIPGGLTSDHEPPPPYDVSRWASRPIDAHSSLRVRKTSASQDGSRAAENGTPLSPNKSQDLFSARPRHVFISQRRRRAIVPSHRSSPRANIREIAAALHKQVAAGTPSPPVERQPAAVVPPPEPVAAEEEDHEGDDDEVFKRFQARMQSMIAEGQAALSSQPDLEGVDVDFDDDLPSSPLITPSLSEPARLYFENTAGASASRIPASHSVDSRAPSRQHHQSLAGAASQGFDFNFHQTASVFNAPGQGTQLPKNPFAGSASGRPGALGGASRSKLPRQQSTNGRATIGRSAGAVAGASFGGAPYPRTTFGGGSSSARPRF